MSDKRASTDHPIHDLLAARWSPYAFEDRPVSDADLRSLFEAARWAPSSLGGSISNRVPDRRGIDPRPLRRCLLRLRVRARLQRRW